MKRFISTGRRLTAISLIALLATISALTSCRTSRNADGGDGNTARMSLSERVIDVAAHNLPWTQLNVPLKADIKSPYKISLSGRIYMRRGHDIYITMRVLGMEVANLYVNSDSVFAADKLHKYYIAEPIKEIFAGAKLSISDLQDALLGRPFINGHGTFSADMAGEVKLSHNDKDKWTMTPLTKISSNTEYSFTFSEEDNIIQSLLFITARGVYGCGYANPATIDGSRFMQRFSIGAIIKSTMVAATISFDFNKVKWEVPSSARWRSPKGYKRITPEALIKAFKK